MDVREKLVELLAKYFDIGDSYAYNLARVKSATVEFDDFEEFDEETVADIADYLISNGVTAQECGYWVSYQTDETYGSMEDKEWYRCSKCENDACGRCYEDEWYSAPILSAYCPNCGAKMMLQSLKGE